MPGVKSIPWNKIQIVLKGVLVGVIVGAIVSAFRMTIELIITQMPELYNYLRENTLWIIGWSVILFLVATIILILIRDEPDIQGNGVAELKGQLQGSLELNWFSILWRKFIGSSLVLGLGIPLGQEGPSIQIGGAIGQGLNQILGGDITQEKIFISSGAAAGLAAAFNAPLSAFVLILEEIHHRFSNTLILSVFSAAVTGSFFAFNIFGSDPAIGLGSTITFPLERYILLIGLGMLLGVGGWVFQKGIFWVTPKFYNYLPFPRYLHGYIPFILLIPIGLFWNEMLGSGTNLIPIVASERMAIGTLILMLIFKFSVFNIAFGSGIPGGSLVPSLTFGALLGAIYGNIVLDMSVLEDEYIRNFVIYGMGGFFTATTKAPLTGIVLITELTGSMNQLMPISIVCLSAYIIADLFSIHPTDEITLYNKTLHYSTVFEGKLKHLDITVDFDGSLNGQQLSYLELPYNAKIVKITRDELEFLPHKEVVFLPGDQLEIACDKGFVQEIYKYIEKIN